LRKQTALPQHIGRNSDDERALLKKQIFFPPAEGKGEIRWAERGKSRLRKGEAVIFKGAAFWMLSLERGRKIGGKMGGGKKIRRNHNAKKEVIERDLNSPESSQKTKHKNPGRKGDNGLKGDFVRLAALSN